MFSCANNLLSPVLEPLFFGFVSIVFFSYCCQIVQFHERHHILFHFNLWCCWSTLHTNSALGPLPIPTTRHFSSCLAFFSNRNSPSSTNIICCGKSDGIFPMDVRPPSWVFLTASVSVCEARSYRDEARACSLGSKHVLAFLVQYEVSSGCMDSTRSTLLLSSS